VQNYTLWIDPVS